MKISFGRFLSLFLSMFVFAGVFTVAAQDLDDVSITGRITDSNGLAVAGASVTATATVTGATRTVTTNDEGRYRIIELKPGIYKIKASAAGFGAKERIDLTTVSGQNLQLDFNLSPADIQAQSTITVTDDDTPLVDTTRTVVGGTITEKEIEEIPNNSRSPLDLVLTLGGTSEESFSVNGLAEDRNVNTSSPPLEQGNFSLSGGTAYSNNITIDGLDNNDDTSSRERFQPSLESIAEVQVITNQFSSEYGRASGGRINLRTRSGTNKFRGRAFMFFRDDNLNANTWYNNSRGFSRLPLTEYIPGFTFSGPVILPFGEGSSIYNGRDRTFFSVAYEYTNLKDTTFIDTFVPVGSNPRFALPAGNAPCPPNANPGCVDGNSTNPNTPIAVYNSLYATPSLNHVFTARFDHKLTSHNDFTIGWQLGRKNNARTTGTSTTRLDDALQAKTSDTDAYNFTDNHVFGASTVNQFRMQYSTFQPSYETINPFDPVVLIGYRNPVTSGSQTLIAGNSTSSVVGDSFAFPQNRKETRWQFQDSVTHLIGSHTIKAGFDVQNVRSEAIGLGDATGTFNFANIQAFQENTLSRFRQNFGTRSNVTNRYWGIFVNDEMKALSNLTISYGLRYERETSISDTNNFGPRFGIAWDPFKSGKGVIRFGAGIFYNRVLLRTISDFVQNSSGIVPFDTNTIGTSATDARRLEILRAIALQFPTTFPSEAALHSLVGSVCLTVVTSFPCNSNTGFTINQGDTSNPLRSVEAGIKIPESYQINVGFERELGKKFVFEANYTWNKTTFLWRDTNINAPNLVLANSVLGTSYSDWTEYLVNNPFLLVNQNGTTRTYRFYTGTGGTSSGLSTAPNGTTACPTSGAQSIFTTNATCYVNLNSASSTSTTPAAAVTGNNNNASGGPIGIALAAVARFRPNQNFSEMSRIGSRGNAVYNGLILQLRRRHQKLGYGFGLTVNVAYTLSSTKDDGVNNTANAQINGDFNSEWARNLQDRRHRIAFTGTFETPQWLGKLKFSPLVRYGSSAPFNIGNGGNDRNLDDLSNDRVNFSGDLGDLTWGRPGTSGPTGLALSLPTIGASGGDMPRNAGHGPGFYMFDLNVTREWKFGERIRLRPVLEIDNILNAAVFSFGSSFIDFGSSTIFIPTRTYRPRQIRLGMRFDF